jgi:hypothetical protein
MINSVLLTNKPTITLNGVDITEIVTSLTLTESLFDPVLQGRFTTLNTASANLYQRTGSLGALSPIEFSFNSLFNNNPEKTIKSKDLFVYKILPGSEIPGTTNTEISCYFASKPLFVNNSRMISKYYEDTISNMVKAFCQEIDIECEIEETEGKVKRVFSYDSPFSHIILLSKQARSKTNPKNVDYVFYQDVENKHHFVPISKFKDKEVKWKYKVLQPHPELTAEEAKYSVIRHSGNGFSPFENALEGMYSSEIISFDTTTGEYFSKTHVYSKNKYTTISDKPIVDVEKEPEFKKIANSGVAVRRFNKQRFLHDCSEEPSGQDGVGLQDDWAGNRMGSMQQMDQIVIYLNVPGNSEMKVGDLIEVRKLLNESYIDQSGVQMQEKDVFLTGKFLITAISHDIILKSGGPAGVPSSTYTMRIKAIKDSKGGEYA